MSRITGDKCGILTVSRIPWVDRKPFRVDGSLVHSELVESQKSRNLFDEQPISATQGAPLPLYYCTT